MKLTTKIAGITMYVLLLISVLYSMLVVVGPEDADATPSYLNSTLNWTYIMIFGSVALTLVFEIFHIIMHPANAKRTLLQQEVLLPCSSLHGRWLMPPLCKLLDTREPITCPAC